MRKKPLGSTCRRKRRKNSSAGSSATFAGVAALAVAVVEAHDAVVARDQALIAQGHPLGVAAQVGEQLVGSGERRFAVNDPGLVPQLRQQGVKALRVG